MQSSEVGWAEVFGGLPPLIKELHNGLGQRLILGAQLQVHLDLLHPGGAKHHTVAFATIQGGVKIDPTEGCLRHTNILTMVLQKQCLQSLHGLEVLGVSVPVPVHLVPPHPVEPPLRDGLLLLLLKLVLAREDATTEGAVRIEGNPMITQAGQELLLNLPTTKTTQ